MLKTPDFFCHGRTRLSWLLSALICLGASSVLAGNTPVSTLSPAAVSESGKASYYADKYQGKPTASGEIFDMHQFTAAHPRLKFGTLVKVTNTANNRTVLVRINDRGPFVAGRVIDLSLAAAEELQMVESGVASVKLEVLSK